MTGVQTCALPIYAISFSDDAYAYNRFRTALSRGSNRRENTYAKWKFAKYTETLQVEVNKDDFYNYGWTLTDTELIAINRYFEFKLKGMLNTFIDINKALGISVSMAIKKFQKKFGYDEDIWSIDSIRKEYYRNGSKYPGSLETEMFDAINRIMMVNFERTGLISQKEIKFYENNGIF